MTSATKPKMTTVAENCPHCGEPGRKLVSLGNYWVGCVFNRTCPGKDHLGIAKREAYAVREWNQYVATVKDPK